MSEMNESPGTAAGTEAIKSSSLNLNGIRLNDQSNKIYDSLFDLVPESEYEDAALDGLAPVESAGNLEKSEILRRATHTAFARVRLLRERGTAVPPAQLEKLVLRELNGLIAQHNREAKDRLRRYQELPPTVLAEVLTFEHRLVCVGTGSPSDPSKLPLAIYEAEGELEGTYRLLDEIELHGILRPYCYTITTRQAAEAFAHLRAIVPVIDEVMEPHLVPVKNGVYNTSTKQLEEFTPDRVFLTKSPVAYNPQAASPQKTLRDGKTWEFNAWLGDLFSGDEERIELFWQIAAASLRIYKSYEKAFLFFSESGASGKSSLLHLLRNLLGERNCASVSLSEFGEAFGCEPLLGASAVLTDETDTSSFMSECKRFKQYVTHDVITVNRKGQRAIAWKPRGIVIQASNEAPKFSDKTDSMTRRFVFVPFDKCFTTVLDPAIKNEFMTDREVQEYVLRRALELPEFEHFTEGAATQELQREVRTGNNPVLEWWEEEGDEFKAILVPWEFAFAVYKAWYAVNYPKGKNISRKEYVQRLTRITHNSADWRPLMSQDTALVSTAYWVTNQEPMAVHYQLIDWYLPAGYPAAFPRALLHKPRVRGLLRRTPMQQTSGAQGAGAATLA